MHHFPRRAAALALCALLTLVSLLGAVPTAQAAGDRVYIIPDSDKRQLTAAELWNYDYETLGYILNEIFARHGYNFIPGEKYEYYFSLMPWYTPNANPNNHDACYTQLSKVEWNNESLVKDVRAQMRAMKTTNPKGQNIWKIIDISAFANNVVDPLNGFRYVELKAGQKLAVYSAPSTGAYRANNGKAVVSTNGQVYALGYDNGNLLMMYYAGSAGYVVRVGYVMGNSIKGRKPTLPSLTWERVWTTTSQTCGFTDDPSASSTPLATIPAGSSVLYLSTFYNTKGVWDYVEYQIGGKTARGFVQHGCLTETFGDEDDIGGDNG